MNRNSERRYTILYCLIVLVIVVFFFRLISLQIIRGNDYREISESRLLRSMVLKAPRGEILDRNGHPIVINDMGFAVQFHKIDMENDELNESILKIINLFEGEGESYNNSFPISNTEPLVFTFEGNEKALNWKNEHKFNEDATVTDVINYYAERYDIKSDYSNMQKKKIIAVRYEMEQRLFSIKNPYTFASDINIETVAKIKESLMDYPGIDVSVEPIRKQVYPNLASHILGRVGLIYQEEYEKFKNDGYGMNDVIGKDGLEKYLEKYLKGTDGVQSIEQNLEGKITRVLKTKEPVSGNYAVLTLDVKLQQVAENSLEQAIISARSKPGGASASSGAVVALDVNNGEVLAMASYPTYRNETFNEDYSRLIKDQNKPLFNRAISGTYTPGSTYKIATALAALEEGVTDTREIINCDGIYKFFAPSYTPVCWALTDLGRGHGDLNVVGAIKNSCNIFFYEMGRRLTIDNLNKYSKLLGLGEKTGIELTGESAGILASREYREEVMKGTWYPGDNIQAAIGQSDNMFTPVQLANYLATVVNGGKRYKVHLVKEVRSYENDQIVMKTEPEVMADLKLSDTTYKALMEGMRSVTEDGTASNVFSEFPMSVGGKTGTAQVSYGAATGLFIAFAPYDNPQIAVAVVGEKAAHGNYMATVARDIIEEYFMSVADINENNNAVNSLLR